MLKYRIRYINLYFSKNIKFFVDVASDAILAPCSTGNVKCSSASLVNLRKKCE